MGSMRVPLNSAVNDRNAGDGEVGTHKPVCVQPTVHTEGQAGRERGVI